MASMQQTNEALIKRVRELEDELAKIREQNGYYCGKAGRP